MKIQRVRLISVILLSILMVIPNFLLDGHVIADEGFDRVVDSWDFENGQLSPWSKTWGTGTASITSEQEDVHSGEFAVMFEGNGAIELYLDDLTPNTTYKFSGYVKVGTSSEMALGVKEYNGDEFRSEIIAETTYQKVEVEFTTGPYETYARLYLYNIAGEGTIFGDDLKLERIPKIVNAINNGGFETGTVEGWTIVGSGTASTTNVTDDVYSGQYAIVYEGQGSLEQIVTNLKPDTTYTLTAYGKRGTSSEFAIGVKEYNGSEFKSKVITNPNYEAVQLQFTTGSVNTSAKVYLYNRSGEGTIYADDFELLIEEIPDLEVPTENVEDNGIYPYSDPDNTGKWKYSLDFSDEFEGEKLDSEKWYDHHIYWKGRAPSFFSPDNVRVEDGKLILTTKFENIPEMEEANSTLPEGATLYEDYTTAAVMSTKKSHYGYFEIKAKPAKASITSSFWLKSSDGDKSEIDVFEIVGDSKLMPHFSNLFPTNLHYYPDGPGGRDVAFPFNYSTPYDLTEDFHVYGLEWNEKWVKFYFDGELVRVQENFHWHEPEYVIMDMETFYWHGFPDEADLPVDYEIEYVRVWRTDEPASDESGYELPEPKMTQAVKGTPVIDGQMDEIWKLANEIDDFRVVGYSTLTSTAFKTLWDDTFLYVLVQVDDDDLAGEDETNTYQNDSFEVYVDEGREGSNPYDENDAKVNVDYKGRMSGVNIPDHVKKAVSLTSTGYMTELAIPWSTITPQAGTLIGFDVQVNDATTEAGVRTGYWKWNDPLDLVWKDMSMAGILELVVLDEDDHQPTPSDPVSDSDREGTIREEDGIVSVKPVAKVDEQTNTVAYSIRPSEWEKIMGMVLTDSNHMKTIQLDLTDHEKMSTMIQVLPSDVFKNQLGLELKIVTPGASIVVPTNFFEDRGLLGDTVELHISADPSISPRLNVKAAFRLSIQSGGKALTESQFPVKVGLHYTPSADEIQDAEYLVVQYVDDAGVVTSIPHGHYHDQFDGVVFQTNHMGTYIVTLEKKSFYDLDRAEAYRHFIEVLASKGVIQGVSQEQFQPNETITRADFVLLLVRALELQGEASERFSDVEQSNYYNEALQMARGLGIITGVGRNQFRPQEPITREDMLVISHRALMSKVDDFDPLPSQTVQYADAEDIAEYARESVVNMTELGILPNSGERVYPKRLVTRGEAAALAYQMMQILRDSYFEDMS